MAQMFRLYFDEHEQQFEEHIRTVHWQDIRDVARPAEGNVWALACHIPDAALDTSPQEKMRTGLVSQIFCADTVLALETLSKTDEQSIGTYRFVRDVYLMRMLVQSEEAYLLKEALAAYDRLIVNAVPTHEAAAGTHAWCQHPACTDLHERCAEAQRPVDGTVKVGITGQPLEDIDGTSCLISAVFYVAVSRLTEHVITLNHQTRRQLLAEPQNSSC
jgi:hypothetical protein